MDARVLIETKIQENQLQFAMKFQSKRAEIKTSLYKRDPERCPAIESLLSGATVPSEKALGKLLVAKLGNKLQAQGKNAGFIRTESEALVDEGFQALLC